MVSINFKNLFHRWSYNKEEEKRLFIEEVDRLTYENGELYWNNITDISLSQWGTDTSLTYGDHPIFFAELTTSNGSIITGKTVSFYDNGEWVSDAVTDEDGIATFRYDGELGIGEHTIIAYASDVKSNTLSLNVNRKSSSITLTVNNNTIDVGDTVTLNGSLSILTKARVDIYVNDIISKTVICENGVFSTNLQFNHIGRNNIKAVYNGDDINAPSESSIVTVFGVTSDYVEISVRRSIGQMFGASENPLQNNRGEEVIIDYGDGTVESNHNISHTYQNTSNWYTVKIYNITGFGNLCFKNNSYIRSIILSDGIVRLGSSCFYDVERLTTITIPSSVTHLGLRCLGSCENLTEINFEWTTMDKILEYDSMWISGKHTRDDLVFKIPNGTTSLYTSKGYPSTKLVETE
jgi:hypothetical protein